MAQSHGGNEADQQQTAAIVWLIVALVIGIVLYLSYFFSSQGKKTKESKWITEKPFFSSLYNDLIIKKNSFLLDFFER